jgi:hypothetical protein
VGGVLSGEITTWSDAVAPRTSVTVSVATKVLEPL